MSCFPANLCTNGVQKVFSTVGLPSYRKYSCLCVHVEHTFPRQYRHEEKLGTFHPVLATCVRSYSKDVNNNGISNPTFPTGPPVERAPVSNDYEYTLTNMLVEGMSAFLNSVHDFTGLNWCAVIALAVVPIRFLTSYVLLYYSYRNEVKVIKNQDKIFSPENIKKIDKEYTASKNKMTTPHEREIAVGRLAHKQLQELNKETKCSSMKSIAYNILPLPVWMGFSFAIRNLMGFTSMRQSDSMMGYTSIWESKSIEVIPDLSTQGVLWFQNLAVMDPFHVLPMIAGLGFIMTNRILSLSRPVQKVDRYHPAFLSYIRMKMITRFFDAWSLFFIYITWNVMSGVTYYWALSAFTAVLSRLLLMHPKLMKTLLSKEDYQFGVERKMLLERPYHIMWVNFRARWTGEQKIYMELPDNKRRRT